MITNNVLPSESTSELVALRIREAIIDGQLTPGIRLIEEDLSRTFEVSRGPIREAIRILANDGHVILRKNRGAIVATPTIDDVLEIYAVRMTLGELAIRHVIATKAITEADLNTLQRLISRLKDPKVQRDARRMIDTDLEFQQSLIALSGLERVMNTFARTNVDIKICISALAIRYSSHDRNALTLRHEELLKSIQHQQADDACAGWRAHIRATVAEFSSNVSSVQLADSATHSLIKQVLDTE